MGIKRYEISDAHSCLNKASETEMIFVLRAKDPAAPAAINAWIQERLRLGKNQHTDLKIIEAHQCATIMEQTAHLYQ